MNILLLRPDEIQNGEVLLVGRRAEHIARVLRPALGETLRLGVVRGPRGTGVVLGLDGSSVHLRVELTAPAPPPPIVDLVLAVPRPKVLGRVLRVAAAFGVGRIDLVNAWRVDKSYLGSPALQPERLEAQLWLGAEQGATTWVPSVQVHSRLMEFLDQALPGRVPPVGLRRVLAHPRSPQPIEAVVAPGIPGPVLAALGPEGGWIQREVETFAERGFAVAHLGEAVLDVASCAASLLGQVALLGRLALKGSP